LTPASELIARAAQLAGDGDERVLASVLSPHFFARLASGRMVQGVPGFREALSYETVLSSPVRPPFGELEELGSGFVLAPEPDTARPGVRPGAWLLHVHTGRLSTALHFASPESARRSLPPHVRSVPPTEVIERAIAAANRRDMVELVSFVSGNLTLVAEPGAAPVTGIPALLDLQESLAARFDSYELVPARIRDCGAGYVLVEGHVVVQVDGLTNRSPRVILARVESELATEWTLYETVEQARGELRERSPTRSG
jgi:hypothetical protein